MDGHSELDVAFNSSYMTAISQVSDPEILSVDESGSEDYISHHLRFYHLAIQNMETHRNYHEEEYVDGSKCVVTGQKRRLKMFYFCDEYAAHLNLENEKTDRHNGLTAWEQDAMVRQMGRVYEQEFIDYLLKLKEARNAEKIEQQHLGWRIHGQGD